MKAAICNVEAAAFINLAVYGDLRALPVATSSSMWMPQAICNCLFNKQITLLLRRCQTECGIIRTEHYPNNRPPCMYVTSKSARQWNILALLIVGLAVAVFAWGLRYKLAMYKSAAHTVHHVVVAKLLSNRERPADTVVQVERATTPTVVVLCTLFTFFMGFLPEPRRQSIWLLQRTKDPRRRPNPRAMRRLFSRPPPITQ